MFTIDNSLIGIFGANFQCYSYFIFKILVSATFLWLLVGWQSLLIGSLGFVMVMSLNSLTAKSYKRHQKALMEARDLKTKVFTEVLQDIRQVKFSATETQWSDRIYAVQEVERRTLRSSMKYSVIMMLGFNIGPMLLISFSLATHAYIYGELLPSVSFTAIGDFLPLKGILGMVPFLMTAVINARVSSDRICSLL